MSIAKPDPRAIREIKAYYEFRGIAYPNAKQAFDFAITEMGEMLEAQSRVGSMSAGESLGGALAEAKRDVRLEFGDLWQMLQISCYEQTGLTLSQLSKEPADTEPMFFVQAMCRVMDSFTRMDTTWTRNNPDKEPQFELHFLQVKLSLETICSEFSASHPLACMHEKWQSKGFWE